VYAAKMMEKRKQIIPTQEVKAEIALMLIAITCAGGATKASAMIAPWIGCDDSLLQTLRKVLPEAGIADRETAQVGATAAHLQALRLALERIV